MNRIILLPREVSDRIAAGEVIERPASIIKELLENSIDAGSDEVLIDISQGGKASIRITDNGCGISGEDLRAAFQRHATSKIAVFDDILKIRSYGFRGEALSSIASIARVELLSRTADSQAGSRIVIENGQVLEMTETGSPPGTSIFVSKIFSAVPARRKFLKSDTVEQGHCLDAITRLALARPRLRVRVMSNGKAVLHIPSTEDPFERVSIILGQEFSRLCVPVEGGKEGIRISGFLSRPDFTRSNGRAIMFYVNGRYVRDAMLHNALMGAYRKLMEPGRYPAAVIFVEMPPGEVDINVHPAKTEVRFGRPSEVYDALRMSASLALSRLLPGAGGPERVYTIYPEDKSGTGTAAGPGIVGEQRAMFQPPRRPPLRSTMGIDAANLLRAVENKRLALKDAVREDSGEEAGYFASLDYIGQFAGTYLIFSEPGGLVLVDQHAAHERVIFERLRAAARREKINSQALLIPRVVNLTVQDTERVLEEADALKPLGFEIEAFGEASVAVRALPAIIGQADVEDIISNLAGHMAETGKPLGTDEWRDEIFAFLACRAAVKANQELSPQEIGALCKDLDSVPFASNCPHGRPVFIHFSHREIERMFRRA